MKNYILKQLNTLESIDQTREDFDALQTGDDLRQMVRDVES